MSRGVMMIGFLAMAYATFVYYPKWKMTRTEATISWDVSGYYLYLPSIFIYHDIKELKFKPSLDEKYYPSSSPYQSFTHWSGHQVMKYTCGMAVLYLPFFLLAHGIALISGQVADGYSGLYQFFISFGSLLYAFLGLFFLRKLLLRYFEECTVAMALGLLILATNYFDYASITGAMAHNYLFTLYATAILCIDNFYRSQKWSWFYFVCGLIGLMVLIRPTEIISLILVLGWKIDSIQSLKDRFQWYFKSWRKVLTAGFAFLSFPALQIMYWKYVATEWVVYSYQDQGFSWLEGHHILQGLFSYRAGWIVYTPVMILCLLSLGWNWYKKNERTWMTFAFTIISLYLTFAWDEWTYGGSLSQRALVQHYPIFIVGMCSFIQHVSLKGFLRWTLLIFVGICIYYNLWLTHQAHRGGVYEAGMMNKSYFWQTLFKSENDPEDKKLLDTDEPRIVFVEAQSKLIVDTTFGIDSISCLSHSRVSELYNMGSIDRGNLKVNAQIKATHKEWDVWQMAQLIVKYKKDDETIKTTLIRLHRFLHDQEEKWIDLVTQHPEKDFNHIQISIWNPSQHTICIKALKIYVESK